jgi:phage/plasmid-associated DNA primase
MLENPETSGAEPFVFSWTLNANDCRKTIYDKKKCVEVCDINKIYGFIENEMGITYQGHSRYDWISVKYATELDLIKSYKLLFNKKTEHFQVSHHLTKHKWGRTIPSNNCSLSIFHRPTRHSLCDGFYKDIDMVSAQPKCVSEICRHNNIPCDWLNKYVKKPKKYREFIMNHHKCSKDVAKTLFIAILFGGSYKSWIKDNDIKENENNFVDIATGMETDVKTIMEIVYISNPHILKDVLKQDPYKYHTKGKFMIEDAKRSIMGLWGQSVEKLLQETAIGYLVEKKEFKIEEIVPSQDGFMIKQEYWYDGLIEDIQEVIKTNFNMGIEFIEKPFDEKIEIPTYSKNIRDFAEWEDLISAKKMADKFIESFNEYIVLNNNNLYVFWGDKKDETKKILNGRWFDETNKDKRYKLILYISEDLYDIYNEEISSAVELDEKETNLLLKTLRNQTSKSNSYTDIIKHILTKARKTEEDFNGNPYLLGFNNGVYDLLVDEFRDYTFNDYITLTTKYDYVKPDFGIPENQALKEELATLIETIHPDPDYRLLYLQTLASGLDGRAYQKLFLFNGQGGNGKGLTGSLMDITLGEYYHQPSNGILKDVEKANTPSPDMINLKHKRYINFKEVAGTIRVAVLRNLTGGGKFCGRYLNQNPETFFMSGTFVMEFNNSPELDGKPQRADYRRLIDLFFPVNFTDDPNKIDKEIGGLQYKKANTRYETQEFLNAMRDIFLDMLLEVYRTHKDKEKKTGMIFTIPEIIRKKTDEFIANQNLFVKIFNTNWLKVDILPDNKEDEAKKTTPLIDMWEDIQNSNDYKSLSYKDKRQYNRNEFYKWVEENFLVVKLPRTGKMVKGIIKNTNGEDDEEEEGGAEIENEIVEI